jgi:phenylalanyl-tRNA synthetase beta subunit
LVDILLFDIYRAHGVDQDLSTASRSLTFRIQLQAKDRTLTDTEVSTARQRCIDAATKLGAQFRTV